VEDRLACLVDRVTDSQELDWSKRALSAEARLEEVLAERARLWEELHELRAREREEEHFFRLYRALEGSISWKLTKPLRSAKTFAGKVKRARERQRESS
jgi:hypothetical protein